ncbi:glycine-rich domain-containing protein [Streptomyces sp. NPDC059558]|uniref:glycine-rich domain-containing protein n=1 Tax=Streptomyces sp. NPDC059558 TaxID=3346864 RepID=UPI0036CF88EE
MTSYRNQSVINGIAKSEGVSNEVAEQYFEGALQFLEVASTASKPVSPSRPVDAAWHAFILHTADYANYCQERFGRFIHHKPTRTCDPELYMEARNLVHERFGPLNAAIWHQPEASECGSTCDALE